MDSTSERLDKIEKILEGMTEVNEKILDLVRDMIFKEGLRRIQASYSVLLSKGEKKRNEALKSLENNLFAFETNAEHQFDVGKLSGYMKDLAEEKNIVEVYVFLHFCLTVRAKYLAIMVFYHTNKKDKDEIKKEIEKFNDFYENLNQFFDKLVDKNPLKLTYNEDEETPYHIAAREGNAPAVEGYLNYSPDKNPKRKRQGLDLPGRNELKKLRERTPLHEASEHGHLKIVQDIYIYHLKNDINPTDKCKV